MSTIWKDFKNKGEKGNSGRGKNMGQDEGHLKELSMGEIGICDQVKDSKTRLRDLDSLLWTEECDESYLWT